MPEDFHLLRTELRAAREETSKATETLFLARERLARVVSRQKALARLGKDDASHAGEWKHLELTQQSALQAVAEAEQNFGAASMAEQLKAAPLAPVTDPREAMQFLDGRVPLLLMPVRLETRFRPAQSPPELWVRVYPDDCSVDTFEPTFSDDELQSTREYWAALWQAGHDADQERGAWRRLAEAHGPGRAEWLVDHHAAADVKTIPEAAGTRPKKNAPADVILTIVSEEPVPDDFNVVANYWFQLWNADGDRAKEENARKHLDFNAGDPARVAHILRFYRPSNFDAKLAWPLQRSDVDLMAVSFLSFPAVPDRRRHAWGRPAKVTTLPDRFVFIGINEGQEPHVVLGSPIPATLHVGPDPAAPKQQQLRPTDDRQDLVFPDEMKWLVEFDRAVDAGMGFRVNLQDANATGGFDRVLVCGVRVTDSAEEGQSRLQTLIEHHRFSRAGFALIPQGSPTNNTDTGPAGYSRTADADESFDRRAKGDLFKHEPSWLKKSDGEWLAEYLGIDPEVVRRVAHAGGTDQSEARAMNTALWPATFGYWMQSMMAPVIDSDRVVALTRDFFTGFVLGRGAVPAVRIGRQPYGILPATALSHMEWLTLLESGDEPGNNNDIMRGLHSVLSVMDAHWEALRAGVAHAGKEGDPHKTLLDIIGLHAGSAELRQRWAESAEALYQTVSLFGIDFPLQPFAAETWNALAMDLLDKLGYTTARAVQPELLSKFFLDKVNPIDFIVDEVPLSENDPLRVTRADKRNYIEWLIAAGKTSLGHLYTQEGFGSQAPKALLYVMLRHALQLGYHDVSLRLHAEKELLPADARIDAPFIHIGQSTKSRYEYLFKHEPLITNTPDLRIDEFIAASLESLDLAHPLRDQLEALQHLKKASTARLERAFLEHLDCCTYRLDAWRLGLVHVQLTTMRKMRDKPDQPAAVKRGIYLGAYAWLENLRPEQKILTPFTPPDDDLKHAFQDGPPLVRDSANLGYIHAPSLNQAVAAAVLRNGYKQSASPENRKSLAVNLTSERVRAAMAMIEGIRAGQSLGALLGYQFERGLHDRYGEAEIDSFLLELRAAFPLAGNKLASTKEPVDDIREIEARNVIDGLALVNHVDKTGLRFYPFGKPWLPEASPGQAAAIDAEVDRLRDTCDAVADVAISEGVYQAVIGNYDRAASTYDAFSKGTLPPEPQVVRTPAGGRGLTHRVALHLDPAALPVATPRSIAEPPLNAWLGAVLPPLGTIGCRVTYLPASTNKTASKTVTLADLGVSARDVLELVHDGRQAMNELDDRVVRFVTNSSFVRPDGRITIEYRDRGDAALPLFEVMPLIRHLRTLIEGARPLRPTDLTLSLETAQAQDESMSIDFAAVDGARKALASVRKALAEFAPAPKIDQTIDVLATILSSAALFGIPQTGWGFLYDQRAALFRAVLKKVAAAAARFDERRDEFNAVMAEYQGLPAAATTAERFEVLYRAERLISTIVFDAANPAQLETELVTVKGPAFAGQQSLLAAVQKTTRTKIGDLLSDVKLLPPLAPFTFDNLSFAEEDAGVAVLAEDAVRVAKVVLKEVEGRLAAANQRLGEANDAAAAKARVEALDAAAKAMFGEHFTVVPRFSLGAKQGDEIGQSLAGSESGALFSYLEGPEQNLDFPVDTWLYGVARVREKMRAWEGMTMLAEAFGVTPAPSLTALQFPFVQDEPWLALDLPIAEGEPGLTLQLPSGKLKVDGERLLYTAAMTTAFDKTAPQCGLLLDEWTEVIPARDIDTGIAFHFDRPNSEAPQAMLLVTPSDFRGKWLWSDVVDALNDTLAFAKRRAVEPDQLDQTEYSRFLPATMMAVTFGQASISAAAIQTALEVKP